MNRINAFLTRVNVFIFILLNVLAVLIIQKLILLLPFSANLTLPDEIKSLQNERISFFILVIIVGPLFETTIFQFLIIKLIHKGLMKLKVKSMLIPILVSSILFGISHCYNMDYMIIGFFIGLIFATAFAISLKRRENAIIIVFFIHALVNLVPFCKDIIL
jgi:hypothetical protein